MQRKNPTSLYLIWPHAAGAATTGTELTLSGSALCVRAGPELMAVCDEDAACANLKVGLDVVDGGTAVCECKCTEPELGAAHDEGAA